MHAKIIESLFTDKYEVLEQIGSGGCSVVYKVRSRKSDDIYALKLITHVSITEEEVAQEVSVLRDMGLYIEDTTNCVVMPPDKMLSDEEKEPGVEGLLIEKLYFSAIVMSFVLGQTLTKFLDDNKNLPLDERLGLILKAVDALCEFHRKRHIHCDIGPTNFIYDSKTDKMTLIDFGWSKTVPANKHFSFGHEGKYWGWRYFTAPENKHLESATGGELVLKPTADIYAMGQTINYILGNLDLKLFPHCEKQPLPVDIGAIGERLIVRMIDLEPHQRVSLLQARKQLKVIQFLLDNNCNLDNINVKNFQQKTPLDLANDGNNSELARVISDIGGKTQESCSVADDGLMVMLESHKKAEHTLEGKLQSHLSSDANTDLIEAKPGYVSPRWLS